MPSPTIVNNFVADFIRSASDRGQGGDVPQFNDFGATSRNSPRLKAEFAVSPSSRDYFTIGNFTDGKFIRNTGEIRDQAVWTHGTHTFGFGGNIERDQSNIRNTDLEDGSWTFSEVLANLALANFVMGHLDAYSQTSGNFSDQRENVIGVFVDDQWKVRSI